MPLTNVRDLVEHARCHGYMVASFKAHASEEIKALLAAAESCRAPIILAVGRSGGTLLDYDIVTTVAQSMAARASVPVAVELVFDDENGEETSPGRWASPRGILEQRACLQAISRDGSGQHAGTAIDEDVEFLVPFTTRATEISSPRPWTSADRLGIGLPEGDRNALRPGALRKQIQAVAGSFNGALVINGDLDWSDATLRLLPSLGIAKANFDRRLRQIMARANREVARKADEDYRHALEYVAAALMCEVSGCLRRVGATGRAADVMACASHGFNDSAQVNTADLYRPALRFGYEKIATSTDSVGRRRVSFRDERSLHIQ